MSEPVSEPVSAPAWTAEPPGGDGVYFWGASHRDAPLLVTVRRGLAYGPADAVERTYKVGGLWFGPVAPTPPAPAR